MYIRTTLNRLSDERQGGITAILIIIKSHEIDREFGGAWEELEGKIEREK